MRSTVVVGAALSVIASLSYRAQAGVSLLHDAQLRYLRTTGEIEICGRVDRYVFSSARTNVPIMVFSVRPLKAGSSERLFVWNPRELQGGMCVTLPLGGASGDMQVSYFASLEFERSAETDGDRAKPIGLTSSQYQQAARRLTGAHRELVGTIDVPRYDAASAEDALSAVQTYMQVNGRALTENMVSPGTSSKPLNVSWYSQKVPSDVQMQYRYRLYPAQLDWTNWSSERSATLTYIPVGIYDFEVQVQAAAGGKVLRAFPTIRWQFSLEDPFIGPSGAKGASDPRLHDTAAHAYTGKRALLIGVTQYQHWEPLEFVQTDVDRFQDALKAVGFPAANIRKVSGAVKKADIDLAVSEFLQQAKDGEQLIIYLSGHGFGDSSRESDRAYFASSDCDKSKDATCVQVSEIEDWMAKALGRDKDAPRHILLVLDACASGRAIVAKGDFDREAALINERAISVVTAGTRGQLAYPDPSHKMSQFTRYLVDGLKGAADVNHDGVIELSELMVWVRWQVSGATKAAQTPSFARIKGAGEMMFLVRPH